MSITAEGYIESIHFVDAGAIPTSDAIDPKWPFRTSSMHSAMPETMVIRLLPARPVLLKAMKSSDAFVRSTAIEMLEKLPKIEPTATEEP